MSTVTPQTLTLEFEEPRKVNWSFEYIKTFLTVVLVVFVAIDVFYQNRTDERMQVKSFSYHAYQNNSGALHSPFLGKVRLASSDIHVAPEAKLIDNMQQSACEHKNATPINMQKCKMMRTPTVYLGKIHSSWSVLGAQSVFTLVKHIGFILVAFVLFSWVEEQIRLDGSTFRSQFRFVRSITVVLAILFLTVNVILDITNDMHQLNTDHENQISIGSIATGFSFCLVTIVIICFSHLDDPQHEEKSEVVNEPAKTIEEAPMTTTGVQFYFGSAVAPVTKNDSNRRLRDMYGMLHTSHLLLVIFPLVLVLALAKTKNVIVDVHLQLIFFSSIFFAVLDIIQTRVVSVLASFNSGDSIGTPVGNVKFFVSLAFFLAKLFVYVPTLQIILVYYTKLYESEWWLVFCPSLLFLILILLEFVYMSGLFAWKESEAWLVSIRKAFFFVYAVTLVACMW